MKSKMYKRVRILGISLMFFVLFNACQNKKAVPLAETDIAIAWAEMTLYLSQFTPANTPTYASRAVAYIGLTMYESVVPGYESYNSMNGQLNGLDGMPLIDAEQKYNWAISFNAAQSEILKGVYMQTSDENKMKIDSLAMKIDDSILEEDEVRERSKLFGKSVAAHIFEWSKTDGGHRGYLHNFDIERIHPDVPGAWQPPLYAQSFSHHPLHPYWGENRTFLEKNASLELPEMISYNTLPNSDYFKEFMAVYEKEQSLTQEEKEAALWWGDDPDDTFTPPGHSFYLATLAVKKKRPNLIQSAETYARVGMAVADAFINCWEWKYYFFSERPNTFIPRFIDKDWVSFWPDPPFPAFPSGHAIQAAACATILTELFPEPFHFVDSSHVHRPKDELRNTEFIAREFDSFWAVAEETADSRFYGGIHTPQDNEVGLVEGSRIARHVNELRWKKK